MNMWLQILVSLVATLVLVGISAMLMGIPNRRLTGTQEVQAQFDTDMIDVDPASITVSENQRVALALAPDHTKIYLVHTLGDRLVTRHVNARKATVVQVREGMRVHFSELGAVPQLVHLNTASVRQWIDIFHILRNS
jgi:hypothetical protein